jgi:multiple sugar transport system permease protein
MSESISKEYKGVVEEESTEIAAPGPARPAVRSGWWTISRKRSAWGVIFMLPAVLYIASIMVGPVFFNFWLSLHEWNPLASLADATWVGLDNYKFILTVDTKFLPALTNSALYAAWRVFGNVVIGLGLALLLNSKRLKGVKVWRIALFLPIATSPAVLANIWQAMYHKDYGILNAFLSNFGFEPVGWLSNPDWALRGIILIALYQYVGYYAIIFLAGLQGFPDELVDAARVDGASGFRLIWSIVLPLLRPIIAFVVVISTIYGLQVFDIVWATTRGGPANATNTVVLHMYQNVFVYGRAGMGAAMAFVLFAIVMLLAIFQLRLLRSQAN